MNGATILPYTNEPRNSLLCLGTAVFYCITVQLHTSNDALGSGISLALVTSQAVKTPLCLWSHLHWHASVLMPSNYLSKVVPMCYLKNFVTVKTKTSWDKVGFWLTV